MSELKLKGTIKTILDIEGGTSKSGKEWRKQTFVISNNEGYENKEQIFAFEIFGEKKVEDFNNYNSIGKDVEVSFNIQTNEWKGKYYTSLNAWKIESGTGISEKQEMQKNAMQPAKEFEGDDLPF